MSTAFAPGPDPRRNARGRPPGSATIATMIRRGFGRDASVIIDRIKRDAMAGDPEALLAAAVLLGASIKGNSDGK